MTLGLPATTKVRKTFSKDEIIRLAGLQSTVRKRFDSDIHSIAITGEISEKTANVVSGSEIRSIFILDVILNTDDYDGRSLTSIFKAIPQYMILSLRYDGRFRLATFKDVLIESDWYDDEPELRIDGLNLDSIWENFVIQIGGIIVSEGRTLSEQIEYDLQDAQRRMRIERLTKEMNSEKQPRRKRELYAEIKELKKEGEQ